MKKNAMLKIAAILMVAVLLTTCAISSTFAKYVTTGTAATAEVGRVAKWGVGITSTVSGIFAEQYEGGTPVTTSNASDGADVLALTSASVKKLVAPGTQSSGTITAAITGTPEVAFALTTDATVDLGSGWMVDLDGAGSGEATFYCPLKVKVNGQTTPIAMGYEYTDANGDDATVEDAATFAEAIELAIEAAGTAEYPAGASTVANTEVAVSWVWDFYTDADGDKADTLLGDAGTATISITVTQSATQIQDYVAPTP